MKNNKSSIEHKHFVDTAIVELLKAGLVKELSNRPHVVNPLTVLIKGKGKERLILDLRHVSKREVLNEIKFENWTTLKPYVTKGGFGFIFDLKPSYHHIDIFQKYQTFLGISWIFNKIKRYFAFTVLPFDLKSSAYIFTKLLRPLVAYWRRQSIKVVLNLDDGFGYAENNELCYEHVQVVKTIS